MMDTAVAKFSMVETDEELSVALGVKSSVVSMSVSRGDLVARERSARCFVHNGTSW